MNLFWPRLIVKQSLLSLGLVFCLWWVMEVGMFTMLVYGFGATIFQYAPLWAWPHMFAAYCETPCWFAIQTGHGISYGIGATFLLWFNLRALR